tara:strand:+ start:391 stop:876 length:486 start_codon:yes stop_codon:yes gene_type:complete
MEKFLEYVQSSLKSYSTADHMVYTTYNVVKDPKLLMVALKHLNTALENGVSALIHYDYYFKRISYFPSEFKDRLDIFRRFTCNKYNISRDVIQVIEDVRGIVRDHNSSEMEFRRRNQFVIASKNYRLRTVGIESLKKYLTLAKPLLSKVSEVKRLNDKRIS